MIKIFTKSKLIFFVLVASTLLANLVMRDPLPDASLVLNFCSVCLVSGLPSVALKHAGCHFGKRQR